jgi:hypothetical protein
VLERSALKGLIRPGGDGKIAVVLRTDFNPNALNEASQPPAQTPAAGPVVSLRRDRQKGGCPIPYSTGSQGK